MDITDKLHGFFFGLWKRSNKDEKQNSTHFSRHLKTFQKPYKFKGLEGFSLR